MSSSRRRGGSGCVDNGNGGLGAVYDKDEDEDEDARACLCDVSGSSRGSATVSGGLGGSISGGAHTIPGMGTPTRLVSPSLPFPFPDSFCSETKLPYPASSSAIAPPDEGRFFSMTSSWGCAESREPRCWGSGGGERSARNDAAEPAVTGVGGYVAEDGTSPCFGVSTCSGLEGGTVIARA
jgi:hypothetical protein